SLLRGTFLPAPGPQVRQRGRTNRGGGGPNPSFSLGQPAKPPFLLPHDSPPDAAAAGEMASRIASRLLRRSSPTLGLLRSYTHVRNYSSQLSGLIPVGPQSSKLTRRNNYFPNASPYQLWSRSFASDNGDKFEAVVPFMGESVTDGTLANFLKKPGDRVEADEAIAQIETDKVTIDVSSPEAGVIEKFIASEGDTVTPGTIVAIVSKSAAPAETHVAPSEEAPQKESPPVKAEEKSPKAEEKPTKVEPPKKQAPKPTPSKTSPTEPQLPPKERERRVPMPRLRKRIANRLKDSQNTFAMLTTFNEVDMTNLMKLRSDYKDEFVKKHGVKLGLMSCFVKAAVSGLQNQPIVNAVIDGDDIIYRDYVDVSVAVGTSKGLVVPVIRDADTMNFADIEKGINNLAKKATEGALSIDEMAGGTFTISNGGVYGSLISTPIINPPQVPLPFFSGAELNL
uniref:Dihydrolipoamide acetyltransferase component of pyruvate dehydrogenase complex n=2 Tax=Aegilops tauschii subsp. strangulata TaxID=200361 RepID=A0A453AC38_AEGTS